MTWAALETTSTCGPWPGPALLSSSRLRVRLDVESIDPAHPKSGTESCAHGTVSQLYAHVAQRDRRTCAAPGHWDERRAIPLDGLDVPLESSSHHAPKRGPSPAFVQQPSLCRPSCCFVRPRDAGPWHSCSCICHAVRLAGCSRAQALPHRDTSPEWTSLGEPPELVDWVGDGGAGSRGTWCGWASALSSREPPLAPGPPSSAARSQRSAGQG